MLCFDHFDPDELSILLVESLPSPLWISQIE
jgi:hypothetical protein